MNTTDQSMKSPNKKHCCPYCGKFWPSNAHLVMHIRSHTGETPYKCDFCSKEFRQKRSLIEHTRIHTGERPFNCVDCNKSFTGIGSLSRHRKNNCRPYDPTIIPVQSTLPVLKSTSSATKVKILN